MNEKTVNVRDLVSKYQTNSDRIKEIADACEKEQRERTEAENAEYAALVRENNIIQMKLQAAAADHLRENPNAKADAEKLIRENAKAGRKTEIAFVREIMTVSGVDEGGIIPVNVQEILKPLEEGFILSKVGLPMLTGLVGDFVWPMYEAAEAQICGEAVALTDKKIKFSKMTANPERMGIAYPVSNQALNQSAGLLENIIREVMPKAILQLLNKIMFSTVAVNGTTALKGPFVDKTPVSLPNTPSFEKFNKDMKAAVLETGIEGDNMCWTMTKSMEAILEGTPINSNGIYVPMVQNHHLCGLPIYTTNKMRKAVVSYQKYNTTGSKWEAYTLGQEDAVKYKVSGDTAAHALAKITGNKANGEIAEVTVNTEYIGLGDWRYQPCGMFGSLRFIVDPYSQARKDSVDFVLNTDYATKTIREEAFILGEVAASN